MNEWRLTWRARVVMWVLKLNEHDLRAIYGVVSERQFASDTNVPGLWKLFAKELSGKLFVTPPVVR